MKRWSLVAVTLLFNINLLADIHGVKGGLIVQLGGDPAALSNHWKTPGYIFQWLETSDKQVSNARKNILATGLYGKVSALTFDGKNLPYTDDLVNLLIIDSGYGISETEIMRVLAPGGVAIIHGEKVTKPWPKDIDEWTHFLHGPDNNAVANDTRIGPPRHLRWTAGPLWLRSHETESGIPAMVSAQGRIFYIFDEGPIGIVDNRLPEVWSIVARDAFNGVELWRRELPHWGWREFRTIDGYEDLTMARARRTNFPISFARRLVAVGNRVYTTLGYVAPLSVLDAATGKTIQTLEGTEGTDEILCGDGILLLCIRNIESQVAERRGIIIPARLAAYDVKTLKLLWEKSVTKIPELEIAMGEGKIVYNNNGKYYCLDAKTGKSAWPQPSPEAGGTLVIQNGKVLNSKGSLITVRSLTTGKKIWEDNEEKTLHPEKFKDGVQSPKKKRKKKKPSNRRGAASADLFVINGKVWRGKPKYSLDLETGKVLDKVNDHNLYSQGHHHRCYRGRATPRFLMSAQEGTEMLAIAGDRNSQNNWIRGSCKYGIMPANGLIYIPPDQCFCEPGVKFLGFGAFAPETVVPLVPSNPLEKGPAYGKTGNGRPATGDWTTFRADPARSGSSKTRIPTQVSLVWQTHIGGKLSQPVCADGKIFVAAVDAHTLYALDGETGRTCWNFTTGGRIDSPPTIYKGAVLFGSADGWVYNLRAADGTLAWRFRAAPAERLIGAFDQIESAWPVHGAVLVQNGVLYCQAGRSSFVDSGIFLYALDPVTGKKLYQTRLDGPHPNMEQTPGHCFYLDGTRTEILVGDGKNIYLRNRQFDHTLKMAPYKYLTNKGSYKMGLHIFSTSPIKPPRADSYWCLMILPPMR